MCANENHPKTRRGRKARSDARAAAHTQKTPAATGFSGGRFAPLSEKDVAQIDDAVRQILQTIGMAEAPAVVVDSLTAHGGKLGADGRLRFPESLINDALAGFTRNFTLPGQAAEHDMHLQGKRVYVGSGGAAPYVVDLDSGRYRASTLRDLYDAARLVDALENIHFFSRSLIAGDMPDALSLDINTAYASLKGTTKPVFTSASEAANVRSNRAVVFHHRRLRSGICGAPVFIFQHQSCDSAVALCGTSLRGHGGGGQVGISSARQFVRSVGRIESGHHCR